ncbi:scavenger receptor class B member 1-like isoform X2 [Amphiura filiformis]|uniref:scavenger receptor class B member 1-like isoform X2 n=1 Tax=Amphiura filiformis TaxID=82378 RepID=UPI003B217F6B
MNINEMDAIGKKSRCCCCCSTPKSFIIVIITGIILIISGAVAMPLIYDAMIKVVVYDMMQLTPSSPIYDEWANPTVPLLSKFYFFEVQNPDEVINGDKPALVERGPYAYKLIVKRANVTSNANGTISSIPVYTYVFDREKSVGDESDTFLSINMPMTSTAYMMKDESRFVKQSMSLVLEALGESMFKRLSVADLLWGYDEPLFELVEKFFPIPGVGSQFGFLLGYNGTDINGMFTVYDGVANKSKLNHVNRWKGQTELDMWYTPEANMMNGTDGMMWHPFVEQNETLPLFHQDYCRTMPYIYKEDQMFKGIPLKRYYLAPFAYENGTTYPPNKGFCNEETCAPAGIQRMDPCRFGSPMGLSNPHFLYADPWLSDQIIGLNPDVEKHENYFLLEPKMGMPYTMRMRLQINMYIENIGGIKQMGNVRTMYYPAIWFAQEVDVPDDVIKSYRLGFQLTELIVDIMKYAMIVIGSLMVIPASIALVNTCYTKHQKKSGELDEEKKPLLTNESRRDNHSNITSVYTEDGKEMPGILSES